MSKLQLNKFGQYNHFKTTITRPFLAINLKFCMEVPLFMRMYMSIDPKLFTLQKPKLHPRKVELYSLIWQPWTIPVEPFNIAIFSWLHRYSHGSSDILTAQPIFSRLNRYSHGSMEIPPVHIFAKIEHFYRRNNNDDFAPRNGTFLRFHTNKQFKRLA